MREAPERSCLLSFSGFEVDLKACELRRQGQTIQLPQKPAQVLAALLERPGQVVRSEEFQRRFWPNDSEVEFERGINTAIRVLRQALSDSAEKPRFLEAVSGRDYRFIYPVETPQGGILTASITDRTFPPPSSSLNLTGVTTSHYCIHEEIRSGGMGIVYRAQDTRLGRWVALKFLPPELATNHKALRRFEREARTASALNHPNICTIYEIDLHQGRPFIAMELLEGETLQSRLSGKPLGLSETVRISTQIACALQAAHGKGIIHRDIKPANIFVTREGLTKVLDFGLAKPLQESEDSEPAPAPNPQTRDTTSGPVTAFGEVIGTVAYMSPEQLRGEKLDPRTDLFSFGAVLYEMGTGKQAFAGKTNASISEAILNHDPEPAHRVNPEISPKFDAIVRKALQKERDKRYATAGALRSELEALAETVRVAHLGTKLRTLRLLAWPLAALAFIIASMVLAFSPSIRQPLLSRFWPPPLPAKRSVAVLPFKAVDGRPEAQAYCQGLSEAATDKLTLLTAGRNLQVTPAKDVVGRGIQTAETARSELGASLVFWGNCEQSADLVRVAFVLQDTGSLRQLRSETITGETSQPFALHNDVVQSMARVLELELTPSEHQVLVTHGTQVPGAYTFYTLGRGFLSDPYRSENLDKAISLFEHSLELDPGYALAFAGLGNAFWEKYRLTKEPSWVDTARLSCERSSTLDPQLAAAHICTGTVLNGEGEYEKAKAAFKRALELEPTSDDAYLGLASSQEQLGELQAAEETFRQAIKLRPEYWMGYSWLGRFYYYRARYAEAADMFRRMIVLAPDSFLGYSNLGVAQFGMGRYAEAIPLFERSVAIRPTPFAVSNLGTAYFYQRRFTQSARAFEKAVRLNEKDCETWGNLGTAYFWAPGERPKARGALEKATALAKEKLNINPRDTLTLRYLALYTGMLGEHEAALAYLQRARILAPRDADLEYHAAMVHAQFGEADLTTQCLQKAIAWGFSPTTIRNSPDFDNLHGDPTFQRLVRER
jgi:serine/threonine protein kinase/tetratricopeptide (TPR) repeat protein/DNA-binding winged helix-turn-helix (wHTH) protein/TolB-like protein